MSQAPTDEGAKPAEPAQAPFVLIVSGLSGSGKSVALKTLEDLDYYCVDNLPIELLPDFIRSLMREDVLPQKVAVGIDVRNRHSDLSRLSLWRAAVGRLGLDAKLVFFDSEDAVLLRRYSDTRRRHPLSHTGLSLPEAIARERQVTQPLRLEADLVIDTSQLNVHQLRRRVVGEFAFDSRDAPSLLFESFAYRRGVPADADFVFDARVLPNPHWQPELRPLTGRDAPVREYLEAQDDVQRYVRQVSEFLDTWLPRLRGETRSYVTVAFGCTGGKHRSVFLTERLAEHARTQGWDQVATFHRELD
ncbi:RNase adapter RapZ [Pseudoxanthomonas winnipegensis]|uniref:RNase adapter RapZ n=1 Tax=Pseudoxanthomonas winnipegensis TaxID=2480810 RepID=A0A4Q8L9I4_9GAMM|nr:RNase adapter RapZ [Pseudoxanthomonas winnipegensis]RZZ82292.1 RNase adapter RapZ [Pseudoxanthomonas winnipegensis]TAA25217.1 RNase adapter RapZ [Pseudoxanthomonas winnipegensis]TAA39475.1 RNase adapter RapZ [Pseudoxanthomonas winnipegensis]TBV74320.1 RNase adapter RapZ [Pseudoxanthomonas winnipegensis]